MHAPPDNGVRWHPITNYRDYLFEDGRYYVAECGTLCWDAKRGKPIRDNFRRSAKERAMRLNAQYRSFRLMSVCSGPVSVFAHVVLWFSANPDTPRGFEVDHKDRDTRNNAIHNLRALSHHEHSAIKKLRGKHRPRLAPEVVLDIYKRCWAGEQTISLAWEYGTNDVVVGGIKHGRSYVKITGHQRLPTLEQLDTILNTDDQPALIFMSHEMIGQCKQYAETLDD